MDRVEKLRTAVETGFAWAKENGFEIVKREYRVYQDKCGCALQCAYWAGNGDSNKPMTGQFLDMGYEQREVDSFVDGFDGSDFSPTRDDLEFYQLGREFSARV